MKFATTLALVLAIAAPAIAQDTQPDMEAAEALYARACAQCHGRAGRGMASFPSVAGRDADYLEERLQQYRAGETVGPNSALMRPVAAALTDEDITKLAAFVSMNFR